MQKDYRQVYLLLKWFADERIEEKNSSDTANGIHNTEGYAVYCTLISLFAAGHFNLVFDENKALDFFDLRTDATFSAWKLRIETVKCADLQGLLFSFSKDAPYKPPRASSRNTAPTNISLQIP